MKLSKYSKAVKMEGGFLLYSGLSGAVTFLNKDEAAIFSKDIDNLDKVKELALLDMLIKNKFVIESGKNELKTLEELFWKSKNLSNSYGFTFIPYLGCNMECDYCFVQKSNTFMSESVRNDIVSYISNKIPRLNKLSITWMGGEPLVRKDIIISLSSIIDSLCQENNVPHYSRVLTNGLLLTGETAVDLKRSGITQAQVSLDGSKYLQELRRNTKGVKNNGYDLIINNISEACDHMDIGLRINIDKHNGWDIEELLDDLEKAGVKDKLTITFGQVVAFEGMCSQTVSQCYTKQEFSEVEVKLYTMAVEKGYKLSSLPFPATMFCGATHPNSFTVDPNGDIHRCWNHIGDHNNRVGYLDDSGIQLLESDEKWMKYNPYSNFECNDCSSFTLCNGGCPYNVIVLGGRQEKNCMPWKWNLNEIIKLAYLEQQD